MDSSMRLGVFLVAQTSTSATATAVLALAGVIIGLLGTLGATFVTQKTQRDIAERNIEAEREKELRQERQKSYRQYWAREYEFRRKLEVLRHDIPEVSIEMSSEVSEARLAWEQAYSDVQLLGGPEVGYQLSMRIEKVRLLDPLDATTPVSVREEEADFRQSGDNLMAAMQEEVVSDEH